MHRYDFRPEAAGGIITGGAIEAVDLDVRVKFGCSRSNRSRDIRPTHFVPMTTDNGICGSGRFPVSTLLNVCCSTKQ